MTVTKFEWTAAQGPTCALVMVVAEAAGTDPDALDPLYDVVDPESPNGILESSATSDPLTATSVEFEFNGYTVVVSSNGHGYVYDTEDGFTAAEDGEPSEVGEGI